MREIKFRAWDNEKREFLSDDYGPISVGDSKVVTDGDWQGVYYTDKYTIEQYTGLKDKNGKEIYEGDIVEQFVFGVNTFNGKLCGRRTIWQIRWNEEECCFELHYLRGSLFGDSLMNKNDEFEVIGNIHDNPELLEGEKDD